jgi:hypothetical protein
MFYELADAEVCEFSVPAPMGEDDDFPDELVTLIKNYKPVELKGLTEAVAHLQGQLDSLQDEVRDDRTWKRDFRNALDEQTKQIDKLLEGLQEEKSARKEEDAAIKTKLESMSDTFAGLRLVWVLVAILVAAILGGVADHYVPKLLGEAAEPTRSSPPSPPPFAPTPPPLAPTTQPAPPQP